VSAVVLAAMSVLVTIVLRNARAGSDVEATGATDHYPGAPGTVAGVERQAAA